MKKAWIMAILWCFTGFLAISPSFAQASQSQDNTYKLIFDDSGSGYSTNSSNSTDQANTNMLIGGFEAYDSGHGNSAAGAFKMKTGLQPTFEANVSQVALLANADGSTALYNRLLFQINPSGNPTAADGVRFAVQLAPTLAFSTINYINPTTFTADSVTNSNLSTYYQPCAQTTSAPADATRWDCGTVVGLKRYINGLSPNTQYCVRIVAMNGDATNSEPGPGLCATTQALTLTFTVSPNSSNFGLLTSNVVKTATPSTTLSSSTNAQNGYIVRVIGTGNGAGTVSGLYSPSQTYLIQSTGGNLDASIGTDGYGMQGAITAGASEASLSPTWDATLSGRNATYVGQILRSTLTVYSAATANTTLHQVTTTYLATVSPSALPANDYSDTLTFTMSANW